jgi:hypothetical protein
VQWVSRILTNPVKPIREFGFVDSIRDLTFELLVWGFVSEEQKVKKIRFIKSRKDSCTNPASLKNLLTSWSTLRQTVKKLWNFKVSTNFSILIKTFGSGQWCRDKIGKSWSRLRFLDCQEELLENIEMSRLRLSIETKSRQIETPGTPTST